MDKAIAPALAAVPQLPAIVLALGLGLLVGLQRGWASKAAAQGSRFAGFRTYGLIGLAGGFAGAFHASEPVFSAVILGAGAGLILLGYWSAARRGGPVSGTASIVALLTLACGYLAGEGQGLLATAVAALMVLVLSLRRQLHGFVASLTEREVSAIARFLVIALVILPLLPDQPFGPYGAWRPRQLWLVVVLVSGFSFAGYLAAKYFGARRGVLATAAAGALVSSTAVTVSLAGKLRTGAQDRAVLNAGIALASAVMFARVMVLAGLLAPLALASFARVGGSGLAISLVGAAWLALRSGRGDPSGEREDLAAKVRNPFDIGPALALAGLVMVTTVIARWVLDQWGDAGLALVLAATGSVDVDSAIITMGNLPAGSLDPRLAGLVLAPPVLLNTLIKGAAALSLAGWRNGRGGVAVLAAALIGSGAAALTLL